MSNMLMQNTGVQKLGVLIPGVVPCEVLFMQHLVQKEAIRARMSALRQATQRLDSFTGAG